MTTAGRGWVWVALTLSLSACASRPTSDELDGIEPDCHNAEAQIAMLDEEMITTEERIAAGVQTVVPSAAVLSLLRGRWQTNVNIASGKYEEMLKAKIEEIRTTCGL